MVHICRGEKNLAHGGLPRLRRMSSPGRAITIARAGQKRAVPAGRRASRSDPRAPDLAIAMLAARAGLAVARTPRHATRDSAPWRGQPTLEPPTTVRRFNTRRPLDSRPSWAVLASDLAGHVSVLAERDVAPEMGPRSARRQRGPAGRAAVSEREPAPRPGACPSVDAQWRSPCRAGAAASGAIVGSTRQCLDAGSGLSRRDAAPRSVCCSSRWPRRARQPLLLKRAEALSVTDDLTRLYIELQVLNLVLRAGNQACGATAGLFRCCSSIWTASKIDQRYAWAPVREPRSSRPARRDSGQRPGNGCRALRGRRVCAWFCPIPAAMGAFAVGERICDKRIAGTGFWRRRLNVHLTAWVGTRHPSRAAGSAMSWCRPPIQPCIW